MRNKNRKYLTICKCGHAMSDHTDRQINYKHYRAECEFGECYCEKFVEEKKVLNRYLSRPV